MKTIGSFIDGFQKLESKIVNKIKYPPNTGTILWLFHVLVMKIARHCEDQCWADIWFFNNNRTLQVFFFLIENYNYISKQGISILDNCG